MRQLAAAITTQIISHPHARGTSHYRAVATTRTQPLEVLAALGASRPIVLRPRAGFAIRGFVARNLQTERQSIAHHDL
jgi:hypothetical protein